MKSSREPGSPREPGISRLARIPVRECGEPLVDLRVACPMVRCETELPFVRRTVAAMLARAVALLPDGRVLVVKSALRTIEQQTEGYWKFYHSLEEKKPQWSRAILRRETNRFWHPPDSKALPGHCTGGAVDVTLADAAGNPLDMVSQTREGYSALATYSCYLTPEAKANRALLIEVMTAAGFSNCADEWWHWSYGDSCWAGRVNAPQAIYAIMPPPGK